MNRDETADMVRRHLDAAPPRASSGDPVQDKLDASIDQYEVLIARRVAQLDPEPAGPSMAEQVAFTFAENLETREQGKS